MWPKLDIHFGKIAVNGGYKTKNAHPNLALNDHLQDFEHIDIRGDVRLYKVIRAKYQ